MPESRANVNAAQSTHTKETFNGYLSSEESCEEESMLHVTEHHKERHRCDLCDKAFTRSNDVKRHMQTHLPLEQRSKFRCIHCGWVGLSKQYLTKHMVRVHKSARAADVLLVFECTFCDETFPTLGGLNRHKDVHKKPYRCDLCDLSLATFSDMTAHIYSHFPDVKRLFACHLCDKSFMRKGKLDGHLRIHSGKRKMYRCNECDKGFLSKDGRRIHVLKQHLDIKDYQCEKCGQAFHTKEDLKRHKRKGQSNATTRFVCSFCGKRFSRLIDHQRHERTHTGEKPFSCGLCGKAFARSKDLNRHRITHTNERPYKCLDCDKTYRRSTDLAIHRRKHTGEKESHACKECGKTFGFQSNLFDHMRIHKGEKRFKCDVCAISFMLPHQLHNHEKTVSHKQRTETIQ